MRIASATLNQTPLDYQGNTDRIASAISQAKEHGASIVCLPELCITGYGCEDVFFSLSSAKAAEAQLAKLLPQTKGIAVLFGLPIFYQGGLYNCAAFVQDEKILGVNAKRFLPREGVHYEPRWFRPWPKGVLGSISLCGQQVPIGDQHYKFGDIGVGIEICEEAWGSVSAAADAAHDMDIVLNPSASHFAIGKYETREQLVANASRALNVFYVYANLVGCEAGRIVYDGGVFIAQGGRVVGRGRRFGFSDAEVFCKEVNLDLVRTGKIVNRSVESHTNSSATVNSVSCPALHRPKTRTGETPSLPKSEADPRVEFLQAEILGLFDYMRKAGSKGYVVSLSGGCDSSVTSLLVAHMLAEAFKELGPDGVAQKLRLTTRPETVEQLIKATLTCVYQKTQNSGPKTEDAARTLAAAIHSEFHMVNVQEEVDGYVKVAESCLGRSLTWENDDIALQNIQARVRAPLVWLLANVKGAILLSTSNRSEGAVGYATMDGDTAGGLAPIAGIDKHFLRGWLRWAETDCPLGLGPIAALKLVNEQEPTAELRPEGSNQTDETDLMPYLMLERIERYMVRDRMGVEDILTSLEQEFPTMAQEELQSYIQRFHALWRRNQWKRERLAPAFHIDDESIDPKTWCRYPILSGPQ